MARQDSRDRKMSGPRARKKCQMVTFQFLLACVRPDFCFCGRFSQWSWYRRPSNPSMVCLAEVCSGAEKYSYVTECSDAYPLEGVGWMVSARLSQASCLPKRNDSKLARTEAERRSIKCGILNETGSCRRSRILVACSRRDRAWMVVVEVIRDLGGESSSVGEGRWGLMGSLGRRTNHGLRWRYFVSRKACAVNVGSTLESVAAKAEK